MDGEDGDGEPLSDIPMRETALGFRWRDGLWESHLEWTARGGKQDPGSGEKRVSGAYPLQAGLSRRLGSGFRLFFAVRNLFDESYFVTADRKSPYSAGRSLGLGLIWSSD